MDMDQPDLPLPQHDWPNGNTYLQPAIYEYMRESLDGRKSRLKKYMKRLDPEVGIDLGWILLNITEPTSLMLQWVAREAPPLDPVNKGLIAAASALASELSAATGEDETPELLREIPTLPNAEWDAVFKGNCKILEASVDAFILGDSPTYKVDSSVPDEIYPMMRIFIAGLDEFPILRPYGKRLMRKLESSRSGVIDSNKLTREETPLNPEPVRKRKIKSEDADDHLETPHTKSAKLDFVSVNPYS